MTDKTDTASTLARKAETAGRTEPAPAKPREDAPRETDHRFRDWALI